MSGFHGDLERRRVTAPELSWALRGLVPVGAEVDQELARPLGLRPLDYTAMSHIMTGQAPLGLAQLSNWLVIVTGSATEPVDRLERAGHLMRRPHPQDRRRVVLQPGDAAVTGVLGSLRPLRERIATLADEFTTEEQSVIARYPRSAERLFLNYARSAEAPSQNIRDDPVEHTTDGSTS